MTRLLVALAIGAGVIAALMSVGLVRADPSARRVRLAEALEAPHVLVYVAPGGRSPRVAFPGTPRPSNVQAYRWNGGALGAQEDRGGGVQAWPDPTGPGSVRWADGRFWNRTGAPVIGAAWWD